MAEAPIRLAVTGASGRMGALIVQTAEREPGIDVALRVDPHGGDASSLAEGLASHSVDVLVDVTHPDAASANALLAIQHGVAVVIGTSGLGPQDLDRLRGAAEARSVPALVVPNFSVGAVLMMRFAQIAARYLPDAEIVELHHNRKADAPSGTAWRTAEMIAEARSAAPSRPANEILKADGARGGLVNDVPVHSVRLPGFVASQEVIFGSHGERLSIRHDSIDRESFMPGVMLCVRRVRELSGLTVGMEHLLS